MDHEAKETLERAKAALEKIYGHLSRAIGFRERDGIEEIVGECKACGNYPKVVLNEGELRLLRWFVNDAVLKVEEAIAK